MGADHGNAPNTIADVSELVKAFGQKNDTLIRLGVQRFLEWYRDSFDA